MELPSPLQGPASSKLEGIIAKTLSSSPCVRWILPARLRSPSKNDLAFVGETSVQLREFISTDEPHLAEATCKLDLSVSILAADVISSTIETVSTLEQTLHQTVEDEKFTINGNSVGEDEPPQVLVLSTSSCELYFLYVDQARDGTNRFIYAKRPLLMGTQLGQQLGVHLARDPESRAIAVAPGTGHFTICALRPFDQIKSEISSWRPNRRQAFKPWVEQRFVQIDGTVVRMDFLHSPKDEPEKAILVLLVGKHGRTYLLLYRWDTRFPLHEMRPLRSSGLELPREDGVPLMLIPCTATASFLLVTETEFVLYNRVMHSQAKRTAYAFQDPGAFNGPRRIKLWTQWGRPRRHSGYRKRSDEIILVREDGYMATYEINVQLDVKVTFASSPGNLGFSIDTAFCFLAAPLQIGGGDILVAGGSMADGGVYHLPPTHRPRRIQEITNAAPFNDTTLLPPSSRLGKVENAPQEARIFSCCGGSDGHGSLAEIEFGLEAETAWTLDHPDIASILRLWILEAKDEGMLFFVANHGSVTSVLMMNFDMTQLDYADDTSIPGIDLEVPTIACSAIENDIMIQVTQKNLNVASMRGHFEARRHDFGTREVLSADVMPSSCVIVTALHTDDSFTLTTFMVHTRSRDTAEIGQATAPYTLNQRPIAIAATTFAGRTVVALTTVQGGLEVFLLGEQGVFRSQFRMRFEDLDASLSSSSAPSCCFLSVPESRTGLVVCGLTSGHIVCIEVQIAHKEGPNALVCRIVQKTALALTATTVVADEHSRRGDMYSTAFIMYENTLQTLTLRPNDAGAEFDRCRLSVKNRSKPSLYRDIINAVGRIPHLQAFSRSGLDGLLIYVTPDDFTFASILGQQKATLRHMNIPGIPKQAIVSKFLNKFVIGVDAINALQELRPEQTAMTVPRLFFATLDERLALCTSLDEAASVKLGSAGETISALTHYSPTDDVHHYEMTLVALRSAIRLESGALKMSSRIVSVSDKHVSRNPAEAVARNVMRLPGKNITAICPVGKSGLLIASSFEILLHNLHVKTKRWQTLTRHALPSAAKDIRVQGAIIYVATEKHSLLILRIHNGALSMHGSDTRARILTSVVPIDKTRTLLADRTNQGTMFAGIYEDFASGTLQRSFELMVPTSIESVVQNRRRSAGEDRDSFIASAIDGTMYSLTILNTDQWLLCYFLQGLCDPGRKVTVSKNAPASQMLDLRHMLNQPKGNLWPARMGIDGNLLSSMLELGPYHLRGLLEPEVKGEDENMEDESKQIREEHKAKLVSLRELAANVMGRVDEDDVIGSVMIWVRGLLQG